MPFSVVTNGKITKSTYCLEGLKSDVHDLFYPNPYQLSWGGNYDMNRERVEKVNALLDAAGFPKLKLIGNKYAEFEHPTNSPILFHAIARYLRDGVESEYGFFKLMLLAAKNPEFLAYSTEIAKDVTGVESLFQHYVDPRLWLPKYDADPPLSESFIMKGVKLALNGDLAGVRAFEDQEGSRRRTVVTLDRIDIHDPVLRPGNNLARVLENATYYLAYPLNKRRRVPTRIPGPLYAHLPGMGMFMLITQEVINELSWVTF